MGIDWVVLTQGDRPVQLRSAVESILLEGAPHGDRVIVVSNGAGMLEEIAGPSVTVVHNPENLGVPGGRDRGVQETRSALVGFLDDDAVLSSGARRYIVDAFGATSRLGAVSLRIVDESGHSARRHVPRPGGRRPEVGGAVALFLGGASVVRRTAYDDAGGYFGALFYGHEELELCWRLVDRGWSIEYLADAIVVHPRTEISRHELGWERTGRNRVWIARRTLPWVVAAVHVTIWLVIGAWRAPTWCRTAYLRGWMTGWKQPVVRRPIRWGTVWQLSRLGRPPIL